MNFYKNNLVLERHADLVFVPATAADLTSEIGIIHQQTGLGFDRIVDGAKGSFPKGALTDNATIYVWAHGNRSKSAIGAGTTKVTPAALLASMAKAGMTTKFAGTVFIWSCFAGVTDGFAQSFAMHCKTRGFVSLKVCGTPYVTGSIHNSHFFVQDLDGVQRQIAATADSSDDILNQALDARGRAIGTMRKAMEADPMWFMDHADEANMTLMAGFKNVKAADIVTFDPSTIIVRSAEAP